MVFNTPFNIPLTAHQQIQHCKRVPREYDRKEPEEATAEFRTCPACGRERAGVVIVMDVFDPEWPK